MKNTNITFWTVISALIVFFTGILDVLGSNKATINLLQQLIFAFLLCVIIITICMKFVTSSRYPLLTPVRTFIENNQVAVIFSNNATYAIIFAFFVLVFTYLLGHLKSYQIENNDESILSVRDIAFNNNNKMLIVGRSFVDDKLFFSLNHCPEVGSAMVNPLFLGEIKSAGEFEFSMNQDILSKTPKLLVFILFVQPYAGTGLYFVATKRVDTGDFKQYNPTREHINCENVLENMEVK